MSSKHWRLSDELIQTAMYGRPEGLDAAQRVSSIVEQAWRAPWTSRAAQSNGVLKR